MFTGKEGGKKSSGEGVGGGSERTDERAVYSWATGIIKIHDRGLGVNNRFVCVCVRVSVGGARLINFDLACTSGGTHSSRDLSEQDKSLLLEIKGK